MDPSGLPYPAFRALRRSSPQDQTVPPQAPEENLYEDIGDVVVQGPLEPSPLAASAPAQSAPAPGAAAAPAFTLLADLGPSAPPLSAPPLAPSAPPPSLAPSAPPPSLPPAPPPRGGFQAMHAAAAPVGLIAGPGAREGGSDVADGWRLHPRPGPPPVPRRRPPPPGVVQRRFSCDLTVPSIKRSGTDTDDKWTVALLDAPQGSTRSMAAFCLSASMLAVKFPHGDQECNPGVVMAHLASRPPAVLQQAQLNFIVASDWQNCPIPYPSALNKTPRNLIDTIGDVMDIPVHTRPYYVLKLCDSEEFLQNDKALGDHECIQRYQKFNRDVPLRLLHISSVNRSLARDEEDDKAPCHLCKYLGPALVFFISRLSLQDMLNRYAREVRELLKSQHGMNVKVIMEVVRTVSSLLCGVTSQQLEEAIGMLNRIKPVPLAGKDMQHCEMVLALLQQGLLQMLKVVFDSFQSDFRGPALGHDAVTRRIEDNTEILQFTAAALYKLQPNWLDSFDYFSISCVLTHGGKKLCEAAVSENISTALSLGNKIECNRKMVFPMLVNKLPFESMLSFHLMGCKHGKSQEVLRWAVLPLFGCRALVSGTVLLGMSTLVEPPGPPTPSLTDGLQQPTGVILQLDFPDEFEWRYQRPEVVPGAVLFNQPFEELQKKMSALSKKHCICFLTENERAFLWSKRHCAMPGVTSLHLLLGGAPCWKPEDLPEIYGVVDHWPISTPEEALFLLSDSFPDPTVRRAAVQLFEQLPHGQLEVFLPQLVQALKYEWELDGALVMLLLDRSMRSIKIAQQLYWLLVDAMLDGPYRAWLGKVLAALKHCLGRALRKELEQQAQLVALLTQAAEKVRLADKTKRKEVLERERWKVNDFFIDGKTCRLPLDAAVEVKGVDVEACKFYNSNAAPLDISFVCTDTLARKTRVICKTGDSLRQDALIMQIVRVMDRLWLEEGLDMRMVTYRCLSTGKDQGLVEVVKDAVTLAKIQQEWGRGGALRQDTLEKWFHMRNKTKDSYDEAVLNFLYSCAGWCVVTFILGVCDRHNDNIMLKHSGHMFHIDFGKIMGNAQKFANIKRDRVPFIFSSEMQHFITGGGRDPQGLHRFVELCCDAYNVIRRRSALVLSLLELMLGAGLPEMRSIADLQYVHNNLRTHDSDLEATSFFTRKIKKSMDCFTVKLNYLSHILAQGKKEGAAALPYSPGPSTVSGNSSSNIQEVLIDNYSTNGKTVTFEVRVTIDDGYLTIKKTFGQFELIHKQLQKHFIASTLPQFPCWYRMSFNPGRKMSLLNKYFKELLNGPGKGNEFVCSLLLDGPKTSEESPINEGSPQIQLYITYAENKLSVMVKHLKNIRTANGSIPDPYVVLNLNQDLQKPLKRKTKVVRSNINPTFNELLEYRDVTVNEHTVLDVKVKSKNKLVAATSIQLGDPYLDQEKWLLLCNC
ncbi:phosphatidylinositol 4-phosphate 3-kinase C2 domain-containing subunit gamma [Gadus morhua]|uniref:phosphatidylinositol 4-phosphate 3-kinase C2 domain-containing subunit gamma n=1 Tax=Gadus morhua TaxID=8049 RepID=UPI0011B47EA0|nr:phosphatidylinositol 4-phosphate 3-kinase C2 domain-containing subunit gamma-like [Gadus morhua]